jgi:hypothetical protein
VECTGEPAIFEFAAQFEDPVMVMDYEEDPSNESGSNQANNLVHDSTDVSEQSEQDNEPEHSGLDKAQDVPLDVNFFDEEGPAEHPNTGSLTNKQAKLLSIHCRLGHTSFARLKAMTKCG